MRGEYAGAMAQKRIDWELPPRARRILIEVVPSRLDRGTTSACAENTDEKIAQKILDENYLRVRGEYKPLITSRSSWLELPPRARRIHVQKRSNFLIGGTTSACAENTLVLLLPKWICGNYLRVRGEYRVTLDSISDAEELPPRARRIHGLDLDPGVILGTTSACAENTFIPNMDSLWCGNYLRVRGEYPK